MLPSNRGVCFNWNALVAAAETTFRLLLRMKTALYTDLRYFLPLIEGLVGRLVPSKAGNRPAARSLLNMHVAHHHHHITSSSNNPVGGTLQKTFTARRATVKAGTQERGTEVRCEVRRHIRKYGPK